MKYCLFFGMMVSLLASCKKEKEAVPELPESYFFKYKVDGVQVVSPLPLASYIEYAADSKTLLVSGGDNTGTSLSFQLSLKKELKPGTFMESSGTYDFAAQYVSASRSYLAGVGQPTTNPMQLTVTGYNGKQISGTFKGDAFRFVSPGVVSETDKKSITEGEFSIKVN